MAIKVTIIIISVQLSELYSMSFRQLLCRLLGNNINFVVYVKPKLSYFLHNAFKIIVIFSAIPGYKCAAMDQQHANGGSMLLLKEGKKEIRKEKIWEKRQSQRCQRQGCHCNWSCYRNRQGFCCRTVEKGRKGKLLKHLFTSEIQYLLQTGCAAVRRQRKRRTATIF